MCAHRAGKWAARDQGQAGRGDGLQKLGVRGWLRTPSQGETPCGRKGLAWWTGNYPVTLKK